MNVETGINTELRQVIGFPECISVEMELQKSGLSHEQIGVVAGIVKGFASEIDRLEIKVGNLQYHLDKLEMGDLESEIEDLKIENKGLAEENKRLQVRIDELESMDQR